LGIKQVVALLIALAIVGGYAFVQESAQDAGSVSSDTFLYNIRARDMSLVEITHMGNTEQFVWDGQERSWVFDDHSRAVVSEYRWGGITLLLEGPKYERLLEIDQPDLGRFGLDPPSSTIRIGLDSGDIFALDLGITTPDGLNHYVRLEGANEIAIVDRSWGDVLTRLVTEPPYETE
jgi:hypothetical protein